MNVDATTAAAGGWYAEASTPPPPPTFTNTAQLLGLSTSQLSQDMQSGTTLSSLASQAGVSSTSLISAIESDLQANAPQGAPTLSSTQLNTIATNIANGVHRGGGHHHHHGGGMPPLTDTAQLLGVSTSQLSQDMQSGTTLSSLAAQAGVSSTSLISAIESDLQANAPQGAPTVSGTQLSTIATNIANGTAPTGQASTSPFWGGGSPSGSTETGAESNLSSLAGVLGIDPSTLLAQLSSGQDFSSALASPGAAGYGTSVADSVLGGVAFDQYA